MSIPRNLGAFADNVNTNGKVEVTGINATGTPTSTTALLGNGTWGTVTTAPAGSTGQVQYNNAGAFGAISSGTSGQVLTSAGAGVVPTWASPAVGGYTVVAPVGFGGGNSVTFSGLPSSVTSLVITVRNALVSSGDLYIQLGTSGGISTSNYNSAAIRHSSAGSHSSMLQVGDGFNIYCRNYSNFSATYVLNRYGTEYWTGTGISGFIDDVSGMGTSIGQWYGGSSVVITSVRIKATTGQTVDGGAVSIMYL